MPVGYNGGAFGGVCFGVGPGLRVKGCRRLRP